MKKKVFVGLSGGVDSAVSAYLLKEDGYDVTGVFMKNWSGEDYGVSEYCPWKEDLDSARSVADHLDIPLLVYNFEKDYEQAVISDFFYQYSIGNTPNPDVLCNKYIKFSKFLEKALKEGAQSIATGHYARNIGGILYRAIDKNKDQVYFLNQLNKYQLEYSIFPIGKMLKSEVRKIALDANLPNAKRKDSQGICFLGKIPITDFLKTKLKEKEGDIIDIDTQKLIGKHNGIWFYTIGQRHGLKVGGSKLPYFICKKDVEKNILYVTQGKESEYLYKQELNLRSFNQISNVESNKQLVGQIRYRGSLYNISVLDISQDKAHIVFEDKVWAPALGQSVVVYQDDKCIGGGVIESIID